MKKNLIFTLFLISFITVTVEAAVSESTVDKILEAGHQIYDPISDKVGEIIEFKKNWDSSKKTASSKRWIGYVIVDLSGGIARDPEVSSEGLAFAMCHELNHLYGGAPYLIKWKEMSAEGQADYMGAKNCLKEVIKIANLHSDFEATEFMKKQCGADEYCIRAYVGIQSITNFFSVSNSEPYPNLETPETYVVDRTLIGYPPTVQCRLDTMRRGLEGKDRPACWYHEN